jgi:hypothetical protein
MMHVLPTRPTTNGYAFWFGQPGEGTNFSGLLEEATARPRLQKKYVVSAYSRVAVADAVSTVI